MIALLCFFLTLLASPFKSKSRLEAENAALRHQLIVLQNIWLLPLVMLTKKAVPAIAAMLGVAVSTSWVVPALKGIGRWTVEMLLMYSLERMDILPADDFGVREGYRSLKSLPEQPKPNSLREIGKAWAPHRTVAAWYLWRMPRERGNVLK
jgi:hypothetical protein